MLATFENMQRHGNEPGVFAYSPYTGEEYSATPGDYWSAPAGWTMTDSEGEPMALARRETRIVELSD